MPLTDASRARLHEIARNSIQHGLAHGRALTLDLTGLPPELRDPGASFVTLHIGTHLRGCIGTLEAYRPLAKDVSENAYAAAFRDSRFPPLATDEAPDLRIHISLLHPPTDLPCKDEADLVKQLRPGIDGLILRDGARRATFLPSVWDDLPDPRDFLRQLKRKAGLPPDYWRHTLQFSRYEVEAV